MMEMDRDPIFGVVKEKLNKLDIEAVLFDLDDTLIYTSELFVMFMERYSMVVAKQIGVDVKEVMTALRKINDEEYKKAGVNPQRWAAVVDRLAGIFENGQKEIVENMDILMNIYAIEPRMRPGARSLLNILKHSGVKLGLVTHANVEWTKFKLDCLGLWNYFDQVVIVDENGHKKSEDWKRGMDGLEVDPKMCLVVGDSLGGDIRPGDELGASTVFLPSPWAEFRQGEIPHNTVVIKEIFGLVDALDKLG